MSQTSKKKARPNGKKGKKPSRRPLKKDAKTSNQHMKDPRQALFIAYYIDPKSETFGNAMASALRAGYKKGYAKNIGNQMPEWLREKQEKIKDEEMIKLAENNLKEFMEVSVDQPIIGMFGPVLDEEGDAVMKPNVGIMKIKQDTTKFVAERLNRKKYGQKVELGTDPDNPIEINILSNGTKYGIKK